MCTGSRSAHTAVVCGRVVVKRRSSLDASFALSLRRAGRMGEPLGPPAGRVSAIQTNKWSPLPDDPTRGTLDVRCTTTRVTSALMNKHGSQLGLWVDI